MARFYDKGTHKVYFTEAEEAAQDELEAAVAKEKAATAYVYARQIAYPDIRDFADAYYWAQKGDDSKMTSYISACAKVKSDLPKPE